MYRNFFTVILLIAAIIPTHAEHIIGGEIYWECVKEGPDHGKFIFYLKLYRDCSVENTIISGSGHDLAIVNHPDFVGVDIELTLVSEQDISDECGVPCSSATYNDISVREYLFATEPVEILGVPPSNGYEIVYHRCCRNAVDNIVGAENQLLYLTATMYPYNGQDLYPCYDSSPQFAEAPQAAICSGSSLRYMSGGFDSDGDSLSYSFSPALGNSGAPVTYITGYSFDEPLPGPTIDSTYDLVQLNGNSGILEYDSNSSLQGKWNITAAMDSWRCGQRVSRITRNLTISAIPCTEQNNIPNIQSPIWLHPFGASGFSVTVAAGDSVSFILPIQDLDSIGNEPQELTFEAYGDGFGAYFTDRDSGCFSAPCATLSGLVPPTLISGTGSTQFKWETSCNHVVLNDDCAYTSSTYNYVFRIKDDYCPVQGSNSVNVSITVEGDPVVESPYVRCVDIVENGDIIITWDPSVDTNITPVFLEYVVQHSLSENGPFEEVGIIADINGFEFIHTVDNPVSQPSSIGTNYYRIRVRSGCDGLTMDAADETMASIHLTLQNLVTTAELSWNRLSSSLPVTATSEYMIYREYPLGTWTHLGSTSGTVYSDSVVWSGEQVNYRIEVTDESACVSRSNIAGDILDATDLHALLQQVEVYPNPSSGRFKVNSGRLRITTYQIRDVSGRMLVAQDFESPVSEVLIDHQFPAGTYLVAIETEKGIATRRAVVCD